MKKENSLKKYNEKRDFSVTPEPPGKSTKTKGKRYLIQKHAATRLHYDLRLELNGTLKSWAVTKGPSLDSNDRRLAVEVEDHPISYGDFEGTIPKGQYGGGTVMLWDTGTWDASDPEKQLAKGKLNFHLYGERLHGEWVLVRMKPDKKGKNNWLLIKHHDEYAHEGDDDALLKNAMTSITTNRTMDEIAQGISKSSKSQSAAKKIKKNPSKRHSSRLPNFIQPQLATLVKAFPSGKQWLHEVKFDGYRIQARIDQGEVRLLTRNELDWTVKFQAIADILATLPVQNAILDGELVALDQHGLSNFSALQDAITRQDSSQMKYYAFDLLYLNDENLMTLPLIERKEKLQVLLQTKALKNSNILYSEHFESKGDEVFKKACALKLEGIVSKLKNGPYISGRDESWLKSKCYNRQEFIIGGFTPSTNKSFGIGALLMGYYKNGKIFYCGKVGTGYTQQTRNLLKEKLTPLIRSTSPFANAIEPSIQRDSIWVEPTLICQIEFAEWTRDDKLRHASFQGLREDKTIEGVSQDKIKDPPMKNKTRKGELTIEGIKITHPEKLLYPEAGLTKQDYINYFLEISDWILPHIINRPLSVLRCTKGIVEECFFQRHLNLKSPYLYDVPVEHKGKTITYFMIKDLRGLITLLQWDVLEFHPWGSKAAHHDLPDRIIFDLDPGPQLPWEKMLEATKLLHQYLQELELQCYLKTTGGKGLHITIPIKAKYDWDTVKAFAKAVAAATAQALPSLFTANMGKVHRENKIFLDYLRNQSGATAIAPYCPRARPTALVAMPVAWETLNKKLDPSAFSLDQSAKLITHQKKNPWADFFNVQQQLPLKKL